jgi:hypothetical protein
MMHEQPVPAPVTQSQGSLDGAGAGDHDEPFGGFRPYHFNLRQFARLLQLRSELLDARLGHGRWAQDLAAAEPRGRRAS